MAVLSKIKASDNVDYNIRDDYSTWGGRNLLKNTKNFTNTGVDSSEMGYLRTGSSFGDSYNNFSSRTITTSSTGTIGEWLVTDCKNGETYTLSFFAKGSGSPRCYFYGPSGYISVASMINSAGGSGTPTDGNSDSGTKITVTSEWKRYWVTWTLAASGGTTDTKYCLIRNDNAGAYSICGVKLEKGNKATDWSPAPEDIARFIGDETIELYSE